MPVVVRRDEEVGGGEGTKSKKKRRRMDSTRSHLATMLAAGKRVVRRATA